MNNIDLNVQKWNDYSNIIPIQDICTSIKMNCSFKNITTELQFTVAYNYQDYYYFNFEIGDNVYLYVDGQFLFNGKITDSTFNLANNTQTFTCYDLVWWVCKNNITKNFNGDMSIKEAIWYVFGMFNFTNFDVDVSELGKYADMKIGKHRIKNKSAKDVLLAILSDITRVTGIYYYIHMNTRGQVVITECDKYYSGLTIQKSSSDNVDGNLIDYTVTRSMQEIVNQYMIYDSNYNEVLNKPLRPVGFTDDDKKRYGIIQETIMLNKDEDLNTAIEESEKEDADELTDNDQAKIVNNYNSKILKIKNQLELKGYPTTEVLVKCIGDINYKVGYGVMCKLPDSEFYDKFMYITASEFEFIPNSDYWINTLALSISKHQELTTWEDIEEVVTDENGNIIQGEGSTRGNSIVVKKALEWAYEIANDDNIGYSMNPNLRNGPDYYDCSAFVIHAYRNGGLSLSNATYTGNMYDTFLAEGFEDVTSQINLSTGEGLIAGDVLLNTIEHTEIYTGNGKKIGAHTDRYAKADQVSENAYSNHPWNYVLRYIITEEKGDNESSSNGLVSSKYIDLLKELEGCDLTLVCRDGDVPTLGYGFTGNEIGGRTTITEAEASAELVEKINNNKYAGAVKKKLDACGISVTQNKFDALTDLAYNAGSKTSDNAIDQYISGGDSAILSYFKTIIHDGNGNVMGGLVKRRQLNCDMWTKGEYYNPY